MLAPDAKFSDIASQAENASLRLANSTEYKSHEEDYINAFDQADGIVFERFGVAVINENHEAEIVYDVAQRIEGRLLALGASVFLTRGAQNNPSEAERISFTNKSSADLLISLHVDHHKNPQARGVATFFYGSDQHGIHSIVGEKFASLVQREICARTDFINCRSHAKTWDSLRLTKAPAVRIDLGYSSNESDATRLAQADFRNAIAESFVIAIQRLYLAAEDDAKTGTLRISDLRNAGIRR